MSKVVPGRLRQVESSSDTAYRRLAAWLDNCVANHTACAVSISDPKLPTRVIDIHTSDRTSALVESHGRSGKYVALSHTWGRSPRLMTTKKTIEDLKRGVADSFLPKTFQDAIEITRRLKIKYLWIDCLCIIQDDPQDWEREAARMTYVYKNSHLTISASASSDSHSGCFPARKKDSYVSPSTRSLGFETRRDADGPHSYTLQYQHPSQSDGPDEVYFLEEWLPGSKDPRPQDAQIGSFGKLFDPIASEPLSSRGWTLQERLLAPRVIHYATDQMYFECETEMLSECGFKFPTSNFNLNFCLSAQTLKFEDHGIPQSGAVSLIPGRPALKEGATRQKGGGWLSLVEEYSKRQLSVAQDKLSAVAGVARIIAESTHDHYFAGIWSNHLMEDLFWRVCTHEEYFKDDGEGRPKRRPARGKRLGTAVRPAEFRAPSWSWASIEAPVKFILLNYSKLVAEARAISTTPSGSDSYGRVSGGFMDIEVSATVDIMYISSLTTYLNRAQYTRSSCIIPKHCGRDTAFPSSSTSTMSVASASEQSIPTYPTSLLSSHAMRSS